MSAECKKCGWSKSCQDKYGCKICADCGADWPQEQDVVPETSKSWDGYDIPKECMDEDRECGKCESTDTERKAMGCTVDPFGKD